MSMIVTLWYRVEDWGPDFNHFSNGFHPDHMEPPYMCEFQRKAWANAAWIPARGEFANGVLTDNGTVRTTGNRP